MPNHIVHGVGDTQDAKNEPTASNVCLARIEEAAQRISAYVNSTPVLTCETLNELSGGRSVFFKCELFQKTGSFKARGACNAVLLAPEDCTDFVTHSSGNHAQALAWAVKARGAKSHIVMPNTSIGIKLASVYGYGASVRLCEPTKLGREKTAEEVLGEIPRAVFVHPSNDPNVICGQGTVGLEFVEQVKALSGANLDAVIVPVGGGGLISGVATAVKALCPGIRVIGAEPEEADDAYRSKKSGELCFHQGEKEPTTIADGLRSFLGSNTWPIVRDSVDEIVTVSEAQIKHWMRIVYERMKLVIEPSAAVGVAALMSPRVRSLPSSMAKVGVVLCGGNVDMDKLQDLLEAESSMMHVVNLEI